MTLVRPSVRIVVCRRSCEDSVDHRSTLLHSRSLGTVLTDDVSSVLRFCLKSPKSNHLHGPQRLHFSAWRSFEGLLSACRKTANSAHSFCRPTSSKYHAWYQT